VRKSDGENRKKSDEKGKKTKNFHTQLSFFQPKVATFSPNTIRLHRQLSYLLLAQVSNINNV
jgi:hypothetical protein